MGQDHLDGDFHARKEGVFYHVAEYAGEGLVESELALLDQLHDGH